MTTTFGEAVLVIDGYVHRNKLPNDAHGIARDLADAGLLRQGWSKTAEPRLAATYVLQCRMAWSDAEAIAKALEASGLLVGGVPAHTEETS